LVLIEAVERVVVQLPTNVSVAVQLLTVGVGRFETVVVGVVHSTHVDVRRTVSAHLATPAPSR